MAAVESVKDIPWWKEPTKDQWYAWWAAWLGWTLDAFDFTVFLLIMLPISQEFGVPAISADNSTIPAALFEDSSSTAFPANQEPLA